MTTTTTDERTLTFCCHTFQNKRKNWYLCLFFSTLPLSTQGVRKDRSRVLRRDKRRVGSATSGREEVKKELDQKTMALAGGRKRNSTSISTGEGRGGGGGGKSAVTAMSPEQVPIHATFV